MKCPKCKAENPDDSHFCNKCSAFLIDIPTTTTEVPIETGIALENQLLILLQGKILANDTR